MLGYRHSFHAGNFADVFKHVVLTVLLQALTRKEKPFVFIDTHAGAGRYDLHCDDARKNREFESGIARVWNAERPPPTVSAYLDAINEKGSETADSRLPPTPLPRPLPRWYPGSPRIARHFLRGGDRMILGELHTSELPRLRREFANDTAVQIVPGDGYHLLKSHLPPPERRGMVLIDPSYERRDELDVLLAALREGYRRWETGVFAVWYPIMPKIPVAALKRRIVSDGYAKLLNAELCVLPEDNPLGMNGSGMLILNPPFQVDAVLMEALPWLQRTLANSNHDGQGGHSVDWLTGC